MDGCPEASAVLDARVDHRASIHSVSTVRFIKDVTRIVIPRIVPQGSVNKDELMISKEKEFEDVFKAIMAEFAERDYNNKEVVNALACSISVVAMQSNDPVAFMEDITERMNAYVTELVKVTDLISRTSS